MEAPGWLKEIEEESLGPAPQASSPLSEHDTWIQSLSGDQEEREQTEEEVSEHQISPPRPDASESKVENVNPVNGGEDTSSSQRTLEPLSYAVGSFDEFPAEVSPRISSMTRGKSILSGSFSASGPSSKTAELSSKDTTYRSLPSEIEMERVRYLPTPLLSLPIVTPFPSDYEPSTPETITEKSLLQSFKGLSFLQRDIHSVSPKQYQEILIQTLEYAINFLLIHPSLTSFFTDHEMVSTVSEDEEVEDHKLFYCDIISSCVLNYLHLEAIAVKTTILFNLILGDSGVNLVFSICDPTLRLQEKAVPNLDLEGDSTNLLWKMTNSHPCEIIQKILSLHGLTNHFILSSTLATLCNLSIVPGCGEYITQYCSSPVLQILEGYLLSGTRMETSEIICELASKLFYCYAIDKKKQEVWIRAGSYRVLEKIFHRHSQSASPIQWACKSLHSLVQHDTTPDPFMSTEICPSLVSLLEICPCLEKEVVRWTCLAVGRIVSQYSGANELLGRLGVCSCLCRILEEFGYTDPDIVEAACWALSNLARIPSNQRILWDLSLDGLLMSFFRLYDRCFAVIRETMIAVHSLFYQNEGIYRDLNIGSSLSQLDGLFSGSVTNSPSGVLDDSNYPRVSKTCQIVLQAIEDYEKKRKSYFKSFLFDIEQILPWLWFAVSGISSHLCGREILRTFGVQTSLLSLLKSSKNPLTLRCGFTICQSFIQDSSPENLKFFSQITEYLPHSINDIISSSSPDTLHVACDFISKLAMNRTLAMIFENSRGCQILVKILTKHQLDKRIVEIVLLAIRNLCQPSAEPTFEIIRRFESSSCNLCEILPSIMTLHHCDTFLIGLLGCQILKLLSFSKQSVKKLYSGNVSHCLLLTFNSHTSISSLHILQEICDLLLELCTHSSTPLLHTLISSGTCEMLMNILIICQDSDDEDSCPAAISPMNCILSCLQSVYLLLQRSRNSAQLFCKMGCHVLVFRIIEKCTSNERDIQVLLVVSYQILNTLLEDNLSLRKQLQKTDIAGPILNSYGITSLKSKSDITPVVQEKIVCLSRCVCLLLSISSQNKVQLFVVRELFLKIVGSRLVNSLDLLISLHLKFDLGEKPLGEVLNVIIVLLECQELFFPPVTYRPTLCFQSQAFIVYGDTSFHPSIESEGFHPVSSPTSSDQDDLGSECLISQFKTANVMKQVMELLSIYLSEDHRIVVKSLRVLILFLQHDFPSQDTFDTNGCLCELSTKILTESFLPIVLNCFSLIYHMTLFNLRTKLKYLSLSCDSIILQHIQQHPHDEDLVSLGVLALSSLAYGHDMLNTPIYHPLGVIISFHLESKKICLANCALLCSITRNTRDKALAITLYSASSHTSYFSGKSQLSSILLLSQSLIVSCGKLLSSSEICRSILLALLNVILLHSQEVCESTVTGQQWQQELRGLLLETNILKYLGYIIVRHLALADICRLVVIFLRLVTSFVDSTELSHDFVDWRYFLVARKDPLCDAILSKCHGIGMNNFVMTILDAYSVQKSSTDRGKSESSEIVFLAVITLAQLSFHENTRSYLANPANKVLEKIIALCHAEKDEQLYIAIFQLISNLCSNEFQCARYLIDSGICELMVWSMDTFFTSLTLVKYVCRCTYLLCSTDPTARVMFHSCNIWVAMSSCLEAYRSNPAIAYESCLAIYHLCLDYQDNIQHFATSKVCLSLVDMLREHEQIEKICFVNFRALSLLCPSYYQTLSHLGQVSDLTKFLSSLRHHIPIVAARYPTSDRIILWSNRVLNSAHYDRLGENNQFLPDSSHLSLNSKESDTSQMVISNLVTYFSSNSAIVLESIISIGNTLARDPNHFSELNLAEKLKDTLVRYSDFSPIVIACCKAISFMTSPKHVVDISSAKLPLHFLEILCRSYHKNSDVMEWGCRAIGTIALDSKNSQSLMSCGVCDVIITSLQIGTSSGDAIVAMILQKPIGSINLALAACEAVDILGRGSEGKRTNAEKLGSCGACDALVRLFQKYSENAEVASAICKAFVTLIDGSQGNRARLISLGAWKLILMVLEIHHPHLSAVVWSCRVVDVMSRPIHGTLDTNLSPSVCNLVIQSMQFHQGNVEVASAGCGALSSLTCYPSFFLTLLQSHVIESLLFSIQLCVFDEETVISSCSALCRLMNPNTYDLFVRYDCISTFLCLLFKYHPHPRTSYPIWFNIYKLSFCSTDCCLQLLTEGILEIYSKVVKYLQEAEHEEMQDEEEWLNVLRVMGEVLTILHDKQYSALQREMSERERIGDLLEWCETKKQNDLETVPRTRGSNKVQEGIHKIVCCFASLLPSSLERSSSEVSQRDTGEGDGFGEETTEPEVRLDEVQEDFEVQEEGTHEEHVLAEEGGGVQYDL